MPLTLKHAKSNTVADMTGTVSVFDSNGAIGTVMATDLVRPVDWNSSHNYTLSLVRSEMPYVSQYEPFPQPNTNSTLSSPGIGTWYLNPFYLPHNLDSGQIRMYLSNAAGFIHGTTYSATSTGSGSRQQTMQYGYAIYSQGAGANSSRLETIWTTQVSHLFSWSMSLNGTVSNALTVTNALTASFPSQFDVSGGVTYGSASTSGSRSSGASTAPTSFADSLLDGLQGRFSGARMDWIPLNVSLPAGPYWLGHMYTSASATSGTRYTVVTQAQVHSRLGLLNNLMNAYHEASTTVSNSTSAPYIFEGYLATTTASASSVLASSDIRYTTGRAYWNYNRSSY